MRSSFLVKPFFVATLLTLLLVAAKVVVGTAYLDGIEESRLKEHFRARQERPLPFPKDILLVEIDGNSENATERWPWQPKQLADLLKNIREEKPKVIALEMTLVEQKADPGLQKAKSALELLNKSYPPLKMPTADEMKKLSRAKKRELAEKLKEEEKVKDLRKNLEALSKEDGYATLLKEIAETKNLVLGYKYYQKETDILGIDMVYLKQKKEALEEWKREQKDTKKKEKKAKKPVELYRLGAPNFFGGASMEPALDVAALRENPDFAAKVKYHGFRNLPSVDDTLLRLPLFVRYEDAIHPSLALATYIAMSGEQPKRLVDARGYIGLEMGNATLPLDRKGYYSLNYYGPLQVIPRAQRVSGSDVAAKKNFIEGFMKDKIVLVGVTARDQSPRHPTPFQRAFSPLEIHAMTLANLLVKTPLQRGSFVIEMGILLIFGLLLGVFLSIFRYIGGFVITGVLIAVLIFLDSFYFFPANEWMHFSYTQLSLIVIFLGVSLIRRVTADRDRVQTKARFQDRVHADDLQKLLKSPKLLPAQGVWRPVAFLSAQAQPLGETLGEEKNAARVSEMFQHLVNPMGEAIRRSRGLVAQLTSHQCQALFNAPLDLANYNEQAAQAALQLQFAWSDFVVKYWMPEGLPVPHFGVGLDAGKAVVGNLGGEHNYLFTAVGRPVSNSELLQKLTHSYNAQILISEELYQQLEATGRFVMREIDRVQMSDDQPAITLYELLGTAPASSPLPEAVEWYKQALTLYRARNFRDAQGYFNEILQRRPEDGPAKMMLERCRQYTNYPPNFNWDGSWKYQG